MKTNHPIQKKNNKNVVTKFIAASFMATALLISKPSSGNFVPGIRIAEYITGNQLGANLAPSLDFTCGKFNFSAGLNFQQHKFHYSGVQSSLSYDFGNDDGKASVFVFGSFIYHQSSYLSKSCVKRETMVSRENPMPYASMKLNTVEMYAGFGVNIKHSDFISSSWGIGFGMYNTISNNPGQEDLYRDKKGAVIMLKCALAFNFKRSK